MGPLRKEELRPVHELETNAMDVSFKARSFDKYESLVFNLDVQYDHDTRTVDHFLAEVYEEAPEVIDCAECGAYLATNKVFRCSGTGNDQLAQTLALFDVLLGWSGTRQTGVRKALESRILELQARKARSYSVRCEVYRKGYAPDPREPVTWLTARHGYRNQPSSYVVPEFEKKAANDAHYLSRKH